jgi:hypothetical protein
MTADAREFVAGRHPRSRPTAISVFPNTSKSKPLRVGPDSDWRIRPTGGKKGSDAVRRGGQTAPDKGPDVTDGGCSNARAL